MNILFVTPFKLTDSGGVSTVVGRLCREFSDHKHQVSVLVPGESNRVLSVDNAKNVPTFGVYLRGPYIRKVPLRALISWSVFLPFTLLQLHRFLKCQRTDLVLIQYPLTWVFYFGILRWLSSWKLIVVYQGNDAHDLHLWTWIERRCIWFLLASSDCIVAVSKSLLNKLWLLFPNIRKKQGCVIPNGDPLDLLTQATPPNDLLHLPQNYILTVGHLIHRKGIDVLLRSLRLASPPRIPGPYEFGFVHQILKFTRAGEGSLTSFSEQLNTYLPNRLCTEKVWSEAL